MRGHTICDVWARIPGLNDFWCWQIQWRIGIDEEVIAALTEPRYPAPNASDDDNHLESVILVQTIYLCQLFLHLQEFDPGVVPDQPDGEEELIRVFQDSLAREFNNNVPSPREDGPAPDGETLERVVRGLMKAQRDEQLPSPTATKGENDARSSTTTTTTTTPPDDHPPTVASLQQLLVRILAELNRPLFDKARRYEQAFGPRTDETWAARFATRVMQWRWSMRPPSGALTEDLIRVFPHDVHPLDEEGLQVYRIVRNAAPGHIHLVSPLQPELQPHTLRQPPPPLVPRGHHGHRHGHGHQRSLSSGLKMQHLLQSPLPVAAATARDSPVSISTPRTPQFQQSIQADSAHVKRGSPQDVHFPPSKRPRSRVMEEEQQGGDIPIRSAPPIPDRPKNDGDDESTTTTSHLLWRVLDGMSNLGRQIDGMHRDLGQRFSQLDDRLRHIEEWISDEV